VWGCFVGGGGVGGGGVVGGCGGGWVGGRERGGGGNNRHVEVVDVKKGERKNCRERMKTFNCREEKTFFGKEKRWGSLWHK